MRVTLEGEQPGAVPVTYAIRVPASDREGFQAAVKAAGMPANTFLTLAARAVIAAGGVARACEAAGVVPAGPGGRSVPFAARPPRSMVRFVLRLSRAEERKLAAGAAAAGLTASAAVGAIVICAGRGEIAVSVTVALGRADPAQVV
jgi:hypothetical protein